MSMLGLPFARPEPGHLESAGMDWNDVFGLGINNHMTWSASLKQIVQATENKLIIFTKDCLYAHLACNVVKDPSLSKYQMIEDNPL